MQLWFGFHGPNSSYIPGSSVSGPQLYRLKQLQQDFSFVPNEGRRKYDYKAIRIVAKQIAAPGPQNWTQINDARSEINLGISGRNGETQLRLAQAGISASATGRANDPLESFSAKMRKELRRTCALPWRS